MCSYYQTLSSTSLGGSQIFCTLEGSDPKQFKKCISYLLTLKDTLALQMDHSYLIYPLVPYKKNKNYCQI